jgi:hypothetical protein
MIAITTHSAQSCGFHEALNGTARYLDLLSDKLLVYLPGAIDTLIFLIDSFDLADKILITDGTRRRLALLVVVIR